MTFIAIGFSIFIVAAIIGLIYLLYSMVKFLMTE